MSIHETTVVPEGHITPEGYGRYAIGQSEQPDYSDAGFDGIEERQRWSERHPYMARMGRKIGRPVLAAGVAIGLVAAAAHSCEFSVADINPNPGQEPGRFVIDDMTVSRFAGESSDAVGDAVITVEKVTQEFIDQRDNPDDEARVHETMVLRDGRYRGMWAVSGGWDTELLSNGNLVVTLPDVEGYGLETIEDPAIDEGETDRAFWQAAAGAFGASDTENDIAHANTRDALRQWIDDPEKSGVYQRALACVALAGEANRAEVLLGVAAGHVNVEKYTPPRADEQRFIDDAPYIVFQIENPEESGEMLTIKSCIPTLDDLDYSVESSSTSEDSSFGLAPHEVSRLELPQVEQ